jgi:ATP-binding cassette subfamily F protein 3
MALNEFEGTVMLVSHDRALLRAVCDEFWMVGRGKVEPFDGDLDDYQRYLLEESKRLREEAKMSASAGPAASVTAETTSVALETSLTVTSVKETPSETVAHTTIKAPEEPVVYRTAEQRKQDALRRQQVAAQTKPLKKTLAQTDLRMTQLQAEKVQIEQQLASPMAAQDIVQASKQLGKVNHELEELEVLWLELSEQIQQIESVNATA